MRLAHFDCFSGISGDMTLAALFDAGVPTKPVLDAIASFGLPVRVSAEKVWKAGFTATAVRVEADEDQTHRYLPQIEEILRRGSLTPKQRDLALAIFRCVAQAEASVHGIAVDKVHFHEVGALDSIADIAGAAVGLDLLGVDAFTSASVPTGIGTVRCAHGVMPVPTPATAEILKGVPLRPLEVAGELTTPTGAAILKTVVSRWVEAPAMTIERVGVGAGTRDLPDRPNVLRILVGSAVASPAPSGDADRMWLIETNLDDVTGETIGYALERAFAAGAVDAYTIAIGMKKSRPGVMLCAIAPESAVASVEEAIFRETGTLGVRRQSVERRKQHREPATVETRYGPLVGKRSRLGTGPWSFSAEYDACSALARATGVPLREIYRAADEAFASSQGKGRV